MSCENNERAFMRECINQSISFECSSGCVSCYCMPCGHHRGGVNESESRRQLLSDPTIRDLFAI